MKFEEKILLADVKNSFKNFMDPKNLSENSFDLLMRYFQFFEEHFEYSGFAKMIYSLLEWDKENLYYDVINSFWTTFTYGMTLVDGEKYFVTEKGNIKNIYKNSFPSYYNNKNYQNYDLLHDEISKLKNKISGIDEFSALCHCAANFMPCPDKYFNSKKGISIDVRDYFPLMADKIEKCYSEKTGFDIEINYEIVKSWHYWLVENREKYCLQPYYNIQNGRLIGIPFFEGQSLSNPCPKKENEIKECILNIISRIKERAGLMAELLGKS